ncbi:glycosyltransferase family 2 protein [Candidatus Uhrbacteria bacterium]|nr:glycosyltransferase family 2 protein [Candidatus Uhrbacteria bacterium]
MISVIIPVFNHATVLEKCLASLVRQTYRDFEVIIVDDGSEVPITVPDTKFPFPLRLVQFEENRGAPAARNEGFKHATGEFVIFLDADIVLQTTCLEEMVGTLQAHPEAAYVYASFYFGWKLFPCFAFDAERLKRMNYIHTSSLIRRDAFPGFDESLKRFQDWDLWLTMSERGQTGMWIDKPLFRVQTGGTMSRWMPTMLYHVPWPILGYTPDRVKKYRAAENILKQKHKLV